MNNKSLWEKIQYYRNKYRNTPNGWAVAHLIGEEYDNEKSRVSKKKREKLVKRKEKAT